MALVLETDEGTIDSVTCLEKDPGNMTKTQLKACANALLFDPKWQRELQARDREQLNIVILKDKADKLKFLKGWTRWKAVGAWRKVSPSGEVIEEFPHEQNMQIEVEFRDREDEKIGQRVVDLLSEYNKRAIHEDVLYTYTQPIEESTL